MIRRLLVLAFLAVQATAWGQIEPSHPSGFYSKSFTLELVTDQPDLNIRYTLNGNAPDPGSPVFPGSLTIDEKAYHGSEYSNIPTTPIPNRADANANYYTWRKPDTIRQAVVLRAALFDGEDQKSDILNLTYLLGDDYADIDFPIFSILTDSNSLFNHDTGIYVPGKTIDTLNAIWTGNYQLGGRKMERHAHAQYFEERNLVLDQPVGIRIHGMLVAAAPQKGIRLYARKEYGNRFLRHQFFQQTEVENHKRIILRSPYSCDDAFFTDAFVHDVARDLGQDVMAATPSIVFVNGEYWGIHNIRERMDKWYINAHYPEIHQDSVDVVNHRKNEDEGNDIEYTAFIEFVENNSLDEPENFERIDSILDLQNLIDYMILETYFDNRDWGGNNVKFWKERGNGKWRLLFIDCDKAIFNPAIDHIDLVANGDHDITTITKGLMENPTFREMYFSRYLELMRNQLSSESLSARLDSFIALYKPAIAWHSERWPYPRKSSSFDREMSEYKYFFANRPQYYLKSFRSAFDPTYVAEVNVLEEVMEEKPDNVDDHRWMIFASIGSFILLVLVVYWRWRTNP